MKAANIIGVIVGIIGTVLTFMNTHLRYVEGDPTSSFHRVFPRHDNVGNVFSLLSLFFFVLAGICAYNWFLIAKRKSS